MQQRMENRRPLGYLGSTERGRLSYIRALKTGNSYILGTYPSGGVIVISYALFENGVNGVLEADYLMK